MSTYLLINILVVIIPLVFSFDKKVAFHKYWPYLLPAILLTGLFFMGWDILFTKWGVWGFNQTHITGIRFFGLPFEELLFFITIPYAVIFTYRVLNVWLPMQKHPEMQRTVSYALLILFTTSSILYYDRLYSVVTFGLSALFILITEWFIKAPYLLHFYRAYLIALIPFFITNGVLTGYGLDEPVVWYNNSMNAGIRLSTIPIEDIIYGFLLIGINISLLEWLIPGTATRPLHSGLKKKKNKSPKAQR
jgi:lycopene cyclase domain-containing protein